MTAMASTAKVARSCRLCGRLTTKGAHCLVCRKVANRRHFNPAYNDPRYRERRAKAISDHVKTFGWVCPGYGIAPHPSRDLTADHPKALASGGTHDQVLAVLCRSCNGRKGAR